MQSSLPVLVLLAGPNGAGKTSFYEWHLQRLGLPFVNADLIAREVFGNQRPETAVEAAKIAEDRRQRMVAEKRSFIFETVLSDPVGAKVQFCARARDAGYFVDAHFIGLASAALSQARVIHRVANGGHDVPDEKIVSRFGRVLANLGRLIPVANRLAIYDNSEIDRPHRPIALFENGVLRELSAEIPAWLDHFDLPSRVTPPSRATPETTRHA